ncbi:GNAT family N-acetyltransferase [Microvirga alba]|uniref:GNAT family N-acetyltransferase n=1 Tax=Microvirga alba TaxID=2791025 RepID=UPI001AED68AF|nr:GNAT family N-acetyltransferase [Microvirga alba]
MRIVDGVSTLPENEWTGCFPNEVEGWRYYRACEHAPSERNPISAAEVRDEKGLLIAAPLFTISYRLDTPFQGLLGRFGARLAAKFPKLLEWRLLGIGSPYADRCHIAIRPGLTREEQARAINALISLVESEARRLGAALIAYKDLAGPDRDLLNRPLSQRQYGEIRSLPVAALNIPESWDAYLSRLSAHMRKDVRRKLKKSKAITVERRTDIDGVASEIEALYQSTRANSSVRYGDFEELPENYFAAIAEQLGDRALFILYRIDGQLAAFNLLLLEEDRVIDKFLGMAYPLARENNLYIVSWMENVRFCLETGRAVLQSGQTAYGSKVRLGSQLVPSWNLVKHRNPLINRVIRLAAPLLAFDRWDPDLKHIKAFGRL